MRVLVTGGTAIHVGRKDPYAALGRYVDAGLRALGHVVERRVVVPGEDLAGYDRVLVYLAPLADLHVTYKHGALYALGARPDALLALDDWQVAKAARSARTLVKRDLHYLWRSSIAVGQLRRYGKLSAATRRATERGLVELASEEPWPRRVLVPLFSWGDAKALPLAPFPREVIPLDPSTLLLDEIENEPLAPRKRQRAWVLASLQSHERWLRFQRLSWPIHHLGYDGPRVDERDVRSRYHLARGVVAPPYPHTRSGWWRARVVHAAAARAVLLLGTDALASEDAFALTGAEIEALTDVELNRLGEDQHVFVRGAVWSRRRFLTALRAAFELPTTRGRRS